MKRLSVISLKPESKGPLAPSGLMPQSCPALLGSAISRLVLAENRSPLALATLGHSSLPTELRS
jgi:hypothetical protein